MQKKCKMNIKMLLEFSAKNYKSYREGFTFSMIPAPKQKGLEYSILSEKAGRKTYKALSTSVIYGPNASGKTSIIGAMDFFRDLVLNGRITVNDRTDINTGNYAILFPNTIPNMSLKEEKPVSFSIKFTENVPEYRRHVQTGNYVKILFEYSVAVNYGTFLSDNPETRIEKESLRINDETVFERTGNSLAFNSVRQIAGFLIDINLEGNRTLAEKSLSPTELFLANAFKTLFYPELFQIMRKWFEQRLKTVVSADRMYSRPDFSNMKEKFYRDTFLAAAAKEIGSPNEIIFVEKEKGKVPEMLSIVKTPEGKVKGTPSEIFESLGTRRFINLIPLLIRTIREGGILAIDEMDASLHPMVVMEIINIFHNDEINRSKAQLIFNTHNPIFLNKNLLRRDEIKFVDKNEDTSESELYSLSDFGTRNREGVRKNSDYMRNYFVNKYGAIKELNLSDIFRGLSPDSDKKGLGDAAQ